MSATTFTSEFVVVARNSARNTAVRAEACRVMEASIFCALLVTTVLVVIPYGSVEPWWIAVYECSIFAIGVVWSLHAVVSGSWGVTERLWLLPTVILIAFVYVQAFSGAAFTRNLSADPYETRLVALKATCFAINAALLFRFISSERRLRKLINTLILIATLSAFFGIVRDTTQTGDVGFILPYLKRGSGFAQYINKNHFALLMEMGIGLTLGLVCGGGVRRQRVLFYTAPLALMWTALVMTISRGALVTVLGQLIFLAATLIWSRTRKAARRERGEGRTSYSLRPIIAIVALITCMTIGVVVTAVSIGGDVLVTRLESLPSELQAEPESANAGVRRREVWAATMRLIKAHPLTGNGFGAYPVAITKFHQASGKWVPEAAHNDYLEFVAAGGAIGIALALWIMALFVLAVWRRLVHGSSLARSYCLGALTALLGVLIHSLFDFGIQVTANAVFFIALIVIATTRQDHLAEYSQPNTIGLSKPIRKRRNGNDFVLS